MTLLLVPVLLPLGCLFLWPLVDRALRHNTDDGEAAASPLQIMLTALALSAGLLAAALFWLGLLPGQLITPLSALLVVLIGLAVGLMLNSGWLAPRRWLSYWRALLRSLWPLNIETLLALAVVAVLAIILVNAVSYPFTGDDVLIRYGPQAKTIYRARTLPDSLVGYPPLVPMSITVTWFAAGGPNEQIARLLAFVMAAGTLGATYLVGRKAGGSRTAGVIASALVAFAPLFVNNATVMYTDIPTAFPLTLAVFYTLRWWRVPNTRNALLAGVLVGVALFTKQSALTAVASLAAAPALWMLAHRGEGVRLWQTALPAWVAMLLPPVLIAGPWYARNVLLGTEALPVAGLYHLLAPGVGLLGLVPPITHLPDFLGPLLAPLFAIGWLAGLYLTARQLWGVLRADSPDSPPTELLIALFVVPYWLAWWTSFSFDARFLLIVLPLMAVWTVRPLRWLAEFLRQRIPLPRLAWQGIAALIILAGLFVGARGRVGSTGWAVTHPLASADERFRHAKGGLADIVGYAQTQLDPASDRLYLMDERLAYYLDEFDTTIGYPQLLADLDGYDYLFHSSSIYTIYGDGRLGWEDSEFYQHAFDPQIFEPVYESQGVHVMRILRTDLPPPTQEP